MTEVREEGREKRIKVEREATRTGGHKVSKHVILKKRIVDYPNRICAWRSILTSAAINEMRTRAVSNCMRLKKGTGLIWEQYEVRLKMVK
jgi:hypothetical protein